MGIIDEHYDNMFTISEKLNSVVQSLNLTRQEIRLILAVLKRIKHQGESPIFATSNVTTKDIHRNVLFLELQINLIFGLLQSGEIQEILQLTNYSSTEEPW